MIRNVLLTALLTTLIALSAAPAFCQSNADLQIFFRQNVGLSEDQITAVRNGQPVAKTMPSRTPAEVFLIGAVYIHSDPESYLRFALDFDRLRKRDPAADCYLISISLS